LHLIPVDFEAGDSWRDNLVSGGFRIDQPAVVASTGVSLYLTREANQKTLRDIATLAKGTTLAMTFMLPVELMDESDRGPVTAVIERAREAGTPFVSFFAPDEMLSLAREAGFRDVRYVPSRDIIDLYFKDRTDGLRPSSGEVFLVATT
jgi:O-methyltransferase involved in polyketide biosynthesis